MGKAGWIALHRSLQDNQLWTSEPFTKGQAWVDMLLMASHQPYDLLLGNEIIHLERGQFHTSELKLAERWKWSRKKVRAYLRLLKTLEMGTSKGTTKGTTITIENYGFYQATGTAEDTTEGTLKEHQKNNEGYTNNNINNINNEKQDNRQAEKSIIADKNFSPPMQKVVEDWMVYKKEKRQSYKKTGLKQLLTQIENRVAEYGEDAVVNVIKESMANNWQGIIWDRLQKYNGQKIEKKEDNKNDKYDYDKFFV